MDIQRAWRALTTSERVILGLSAAIALLLLTAGAVLVAGTPFQPAQTDVAGGEIVDTDGDGLSDAEELLVYGTDPLNPDTSEDGIPDGWAAQHMRINPDTGLPSPDPARNTSNEDPSKSGLTNRQEHRLGTDPWKQDTSGDGFHDGWLHEAGLDPTQAHDPDHVCSPDGMTLQEKWDNGLDACAADSSGNGLFDVEAIEGRAEIGGQVFTFEPTDPSLYSTGGSGLPDGFAVFYGLDPYDANVGRVDHSGDGMTANEEARWSIERFDGDVRRAIVDGLDLMDPDSSDNGIPDAWLIRHGLDPLDPTIADEDPSDSGLTNLEEYQWGTDPNLADTDGDGLTDGEEVQGWTITVDGQERQVSSNPLLMDSSGDGMTDVEARQGEIEINGETITFPPVDPMLPDTSGDGLTDYATLTLTFGPNDELLDPTLSDTSGSGIPDGLEFAYWTMRQQATETGEWPQPHDVDLPEHVDVRLFERFQETYGDFPEHAGWPEHIEPPTRTDGDCYDQAAAAIQAQDPTALGPGGDLSGDCIPNVLSPTSAHYAPDPDLPPNTEPLLDGDQLAPPDRAGRTLPATDPALVSTSGDALPDDWEIRWARHTVDATGQPAWVPNPLETDSLQDGTPDAEDSWPGKVDNTPACWEDIPYEDDAHREATGAGPPWLSQAFTNVNEMDLGTHPIGPRACDTDTDNLVDGWEAAYSAHPNIDAMDPLPSPWDGAIVQTICYPGSISDPPLEDPEDHPNIHTVNVDVPSSGPVTAPLDDELLPPSNPRSNEPSAWTIPGQGCTWTGDEATQGSQCPDCTIVGTVVTLETQQWFKTNPLTDDTAGDGAPDAWKILWYLLAQGPDRDLITPFAQETPQDPVGDGLMMGETFQLGASPLVEDTIGDGIADGNADDPLSRGEGQIALRDDIGDHLLDSTCDEGDPAGTFAPGDAEREDRLRAMQIVEVDEGVFLCEPRLDPNAQNHDVDNDGIPDAVELLHAYRENPDQRPQLLDAHEDLSGNGLSTLSELTLGQPADWPSEEPWWFGSNPYTDTGLDADGNGLAEALFLDPDPFTNLPDAPSPANAWDLACQAGIVCHQPGDAFDWASSTGETSYEVTLTDVGSPSGGDRVVEKGSTNLPATVDVTRDGSPAADHPVAILALSSADANRLEDGDMTVLGNPTNVLCIEHTNAQGTLTTSGCSVESTQTTTDLSTTTRTWLGSSAPTWERALTVLDPTNSHQQQGTPENQPRIVAWALGHDDDNGAADTQPVLVDTTTSIEITDLDATATSGTTIPITVHLTDGAGDPLTQGEVTLTLGDDTYTQPATGSTSITFPDVQLPRVDDAHDATLTASYSHNPATFIAPSDDTRTLRVLPTPEISLVPPRKAIAGLPAATEVTVHDEGTPVQGTVNITLDSVTVQETLQGDGTALVRLDIPTDVTPGTSTLSVTFEGTTAYGVQTATQDVPVKQRFNATITPDVTRLGQEQPFSVRLVDLAGRAPMLDVNLTVNLAHETKQATLSQGSELAAVSLPITSRIGDTHLNVTASTEQDRRYEPLQTTTPLTVFSTAQTSFTTDAKPPGTAPRGASVTTTAHATDEHDRPIPEATLTVAWPYGETQTPVRDGHAVFSLAVPSTADPEPLPLSWTLEGPGVERTQGTQHIPVLVETNLTLDADPDPLAGTVDVPIRLLDDGSDPISGHTVHVSWPLGEGAQAETNTDGHATATLIIPDDAPPGDHPITARFHGDTTFTATEATTTVPIRSATQFDLPDTITWNEGQSLTLSGAIVSADTGQPVRLPVEALHGSKPIATAAPQETFQLSLDPGTVEDIAGQTSQFTLQLRTPGDDTWAPAEGSVLVERQVPVTLSTNVNRTDDGDALVTIQATTPQGALSNAPIGIGGQGTAPMTVDTNDEGEATVRVGQGAGTLVVRFGGDDQHAPSSATVSVAQPVAPTAGDLAWIGLAAVLALLVVDAWIVYRVIQRIRVGQRVEEVLRELEDQLVIGDEVQASIYQAYLRLRATAEALGEPEHETETVREFGERFVERLKLDDAPVMGLIGIFERAWYGDVDASMRTEAIEQLRALKTHLRDEGLVA